MQFEDSLHFLPLAQLLMKFTLSANKSTYFWYIKSQDWYVNQSQVLCKSIITKERILAHLIRIVTIQKKK